MQVSDAWPSIVGPAYARRHDLAMLVILVALDILT